MKNRIALVTIFVALGLALPAFAEGTTQGLDQEAQAKVKKELSGLAEAFGVDMPKAEEPAKPTETAKPAALAPSKTAAQVADKALDMVKDLVVSVSKTLESVAPNVWRIMIRQQYAKAVADLILPWMLFVMVILFWTILKKKWPQPENMNSDDGGVVAWVAFQWVVPIVVGVIFFIWGAIALSNSIKYLVNPEYYAVRDLLQMLLNPSGVK